MKQYGSGKICHAADGYILSHCFGSLMSEFKVLFRMCRLLFGYRHEHSGNRVMEWAVLTFAVAAYAQHKSSLHPPFAARKLKKTPRRRTLNAPFFQEIAYGRTFQIPL
ncbi:hypothetical protein HMPREF9098_1899 [Kingella denitrificans ATCC 33394]|uniref:Uncharacterized protein n=1 Tax=Kingella denitrificans ATCC 33394 TaxID=888741 RepID=F0F1B4_9NEIS|nr:hypothetical protein HMPREF9098_1899 [Kingella denitrificans ATCC 33394]